MADLNKVHFQNEIKMNSNKANTVNTVLSICNGCTLGDLNQTEKFYRTPFTVL